MKDKDIRLMLCIKNEGCDDLEVRKVYEILPDADAEKDNYLRVIDESGEDYLYPAENFYAIEIAAKVRDSLLHAA